MTMKKSKLRVEMKKNSNVILWFGVDFLQTWKKWLMYIFVLSKLNFQVSFKILFLGQSIKWSQSKIFQIFTGFPCGFIYCGLKRPIQRCSWKCVCSKLGCYHIFWKCCHWCWCIFKSSCKLTKMSPLIFDYFKKWYWFRL